jgi:5S rRNA maturation endonuclease (ribonuclease M5)
MPKSTKAVKHSDEKQKKAWLRVVKSSSYKIETEATNRTILIVCEGQTEELYFKSFPVVSLRVEAMGIGQSKLKLVETTAQLRKKEKYEEVWCVFDMDYKVDESNCKSDFDNAIAKAIQLKMKVAYSNDTFELWFYLHYEYTNQHNHRTFYYEQLGNFWEMNYEKDGKRQKFAYQNYNRLIEDPKSNQQQAIERAKKLYKDKNYLPFHQQNPVTKVFELVELLNKNLKK